MAWLWVLCLTGAPLCPGFERFEPGVRKGAVARGIARGVDSIPVPMADELHEADSVLLVQRCDALVGRGDCFLSVGFGCPLDGVVIGPFQIALGDEHWVVLVGVLEWSSRSLSDSKFSEGERQRLLTIEDESIKNNL